jgi:hypothetical protein
MLGPQSLRKAHGCTTSFGARRPRYVGVQKPRRGSGSGYRPPSPDRPAPTGRGRVRRSRLSARRTGGYSEERARVGPKAVRPQSRGRGRASRRRPSKGQP